jgi:hypothetical protein
MKIAIVRQLGRGEKGVLPVCNGGFCDADKPASSMWRIR